MADQAADGAPAVHTDGSPLLKAVYLSRLRLTRLLLEGGAYINESNDLGETPLMVVCKSKHVDQQSVPRAKMVRYLLESGADANIQDKSGKTALMHACLERAGTDVVAQLLEGDADPSLEDHSGSSALVHAVNAKDKDTLRMLMDACKAKGKEVIIITTTTTSMENVASGGGGGKQVTKQYLNVPPMAALERWDQLNPPALSCTSPSDIELQTSDGGNSATNPPGAVPKQVFSFQDCNGVTISQPNSPCRQWGEPRKVLEKSAHHLQRLNSEPWLQIPPSFLAQQQGLATPPPIEDLPDISPEEELLFRMKQMAFSSGPLTRHWSIDLREAGGLSQAGKVNADQGDGGIGTRVSRQEFGLTPGRKMSFDGLSSSHSLSHPNLHARTTAEPAAVALDRGPDKSLPNLAVSSLRNIISRRNLGMEHYNSDSQLSFQNANSLEDLKGAVDRKRLVTSRSSTLVGSRDSLEGNPLAHAHVPQRRHPVSLEQRLSAAQLSDLPSLPRQGYLPPLNQHTLNPCMVGVNSTLNTPASSTMLANNRLGCGTLSAVKPCYPPQAPAGFLKDQKNRRMLLRRHSMQTEQIKQLGDFTEIYGH
ncbi:ankyrin repeat domain-containing protein 34B [Engraulis encrasicolus]|uniref:ankyrin repeat domain-containing protein 34B n=1 Tax=Engraulis encrasicolus TaxID=184585 RepID=UPI002FCF05B3